MKFFDRTINPDEADDDMLLNSYRTGADLAVLGRLYEKYVPLVYGVCLKYLKDEEQAKDAVMGIFEELVSKAKQHEIKQFRGWLYVLARNYCLMQLRAGKKMEMVELDEVMENTTFLHPDSTYSEEHLKVLQRCMEKLPVKQKESVDLFYLQEKCYKEIADATGHTLNEIKSYIQNGKRNLKICLQKNSE
ncbi:sigma-70 family RNA polymerase sigma factor [Mucilaginibacter hurinus]|uniref:Sigma-70 family RNA polymerase sigma factor n=1 Tax=Mucilaginibacter hurinus TaxID=2201324 RepID=A0A367GN65_9SPHI|nr:sigma-70 family RNA polymerase sigma factor [Mucilaginibacter hurinus]RCH54478.1 sigma-70 family RNA polymerase sigma factor [Mucilaginibacter hurinus]